MHRKICRFFKYPVPNPVEGCHYYAIRSSKEITIHIGRSGKAIPLCNTECVQVAHALREMQNGDVDKVMAALEVLARLAWSDDEVGHLENAQTLTLSCRLKPCHLHVDLETLQTTHFATSRRR